ncbi:MAG: hypothetical protein LLG40_03245 [Deltaproteobacteria bacterium]|nr:hypothetical protein [Deltaproteobacteria bacterium]
MEETTTVNFIGFFFIILSSLLIFFLPRRLAIFPMLLTVCYITIGQRIVFAGLNFPIFRILIFFGFLRLIIRNEIYSLKLNNIDKAIIWWVIISIVTGVLLEKSWQGLINRLGLAYNALGCYYLFRFLIKDRQDLAALLKMIAIIILPLAISVVIEKTTARNIFSIFGGVPEITIIRNEKLRCQGPFRHPILMGTFAATLIPIFVSLWFQDKGGKLFSMIGIICATVITYASASSGPLFTYIFALIALFMWPMRNNMRSVRWVILIGLVALNMIMKAPIWFLIARIAELTGGTGWHRSELIDTAIKHFSEWWLIGTTYTAHWMPYTSFDPNMADITNQFILEGVNGGILRMCAFLIILIMCFRELGISNITLKDQPIDLKIFSWSLGAALFAHVVSFMSVSYFDQIIVFWYLLLAIISISSSITANQTKVNQVLQQV